MKKEDFLAMIKELNDLEIIQEDDEIIEIPDDVCSKYFVNAKVLKNGIDPDEHRWYETSVTVYDCNGFLLGIKTISKLYSEECSIKDCSHIITFHEMKEIKTVTYKYA